MLTRNNQREWVADQQLIWMPNPSAAYFLPGSLHTDDLFGLMLEHRD